eukprot:2962615-Pyramimonas_sp.AAC.1
MSPSKTLATARPLRKRFTISWLAWPNGSVTSGVSGSSRSDWIRSSPRESSMENSTRSAPRPDCKKGRLASSAARTSDALPHRRTPTWREDSLGFLPQGHSLQRFVHERVTGLTTFGHSLQQFVHERVTGRTTFGHSLQRFVHERVTGLTTFGHSLQRFVYERVTGLTTFGQSLQRFVHERVTGPTTFAKGLDHNCLTNGM